MKRNLCMFALLLPLLLLLAVQAHAAQPTSGSCGANLRWNLDKTTGVLTISGSGPMKDYGYNAPWYSTENRSHVRTIVVEEGCTYIGETAFGQLPNLTAVTLPATVTGLGKESFLSDRSLTTVVMPGVVTAADYCFKNCTALTEIEFSDGFSSMGMRCFTSCTALTRVVFPGTLDTVGSLIFVDCNALQEVILGDGFTGENCAAYAFMGRQGKGALFHIPDSFTCSDVELFDANIDRFYAHTGSDGAMTLGRLELSFTDPDEAHPVRKRHLFDDDGAEAGLQLEAILDPAWTDIEIPSGYTIIACDFARDVTRVVLPDTVTHMTGNFSGCAQLETVELPNGLTELPTGMFYQCASLASIRLPDSLATIGGSAFRGCSALTAIELPEGLRSVDKYAFAGSGLTGVDLPDSVTAIGDYAFQACRSLGSVHLPAALDALGIYAFADCSALTAPVTVPSGIAAVPEYCFENCYALTEILLPDGLSAIGRAAFKGCRTLTALPIPETVTTIGSYAFQGCESLTDIALPPEVTFIPDYALAGTGITCFTVPETITSMGSHVFEYCTALAEVSFPSGLTALPDCTFRGCAALTDAALPPALTSIGMYAFDGCEALRGLDIPRTVTVIGDGAFRYCSALETFQWPSSVAAINSSMFMYCSALRHLIIPETVTVIQENAFYGCIRLHSLYLPAGVTSLSSMNSYSGITFFFSKDASYLIQRCDEIGLRYFLTDTAEDLVLLPAGLTEIEAGSFEGTIAQEYRISEDCTSIGSRAFADLPDGTVIVFLGRNAEIAADAFADSEVFFVCPGGGTVLDYLRQNGLAVYVTYYN